MSDKLSEKDNSGKNTRQQSLEFLSSVFDYDLSVIENALDDAGGDIELAMDSLLNYSSLQEMKQEELLPLASELPGDDIIDLSLPLDSSLPQDDAALARELAAQFKINDEQYDAELARKLQDEWNNEGDECSPPDIPFSEKTLSDEVFLQYLHDSPPIDRLFVFYSIFWIILLI